MNFISISLAVSAVSIMIGFVYSYIVLYTDWLKKFSIQERRHNVGHFADRLPLITINIMLLFIISGGGLYFVEDWFEVAAPSAWWIIPVQLLSMIVIDDLYFYWFHRTMHENAFLYRKIHRIHHKATQPFPLEFIYAHPLEWLTGAIGVLIGVVVLHQFGLINAYAFWAYVAFRNLHEVEIHSGTRSLIAHHIPFWGTVEHHDFHHSRVTANYASTFTLWDKIFGTAVDK